MRQAVFLLSLIIATPAHAQATPGVRSLPSANASTNLAERPFVMAIENVFLSRNGTTVTGRIESGTVRVGGELELVGSGPTRRIRVERIDRFGRRVGEARAGQSVRIRFYPTQRGVVLAGQVIATRGAMQNCVIFDALVTPLPRGRGGTAYFRLRTETIDGRIIFTGPSRPGSGAVPARVSLGTGVAMSPGQPFAFGRKGHFFGSGTVGRCLFGLDIEEEGYGDEDGLVGLVDDVMVVNHGTRTMNELIAWILVHRLGMNPAGIRPDARIVEDLKSSRDAVVRAIEKEMFVDISDEAAARIDTVADAARAVRKALPQPAG